MTKANTIRMAREAGALVSPGISSADVTFSPASLERFFSLAAAADRAAQPAPCQHRFMYFGTEQKRRRCADCNTLEPMQPVQPAAWRPIDTAPRDGTIVRLLVDFCENSLEDTPNSVQTIGHSNFEHDGEDRWQFAGWCWTNDRYTQGEGTPIGWLPLDAIAQPVQPKPYAWFWCHGSDSGVLTAAQDYEHHKKTYAGMTFIPVFTRPDHSEEVLDMVDWEAVASDVDLARLCEAPAFVKDLTKERDSLAAVLAMIAQISPYDTSSMGYVVAKAKAAIEAKHGIGGAMFRVHGFLDNKKVIDWHMEHLPRTGDTVRFSGERYGKVTEIVWCMDEDGTGTRVNMRMVTDAAHGIGDKT